LSGSPIGFIDRGFHELKGLSEPRRVYLVESVVGSATEVREDD
jgi:hypothetical protein